MGTLSYWTEDLIDLGFAARVMAEPERLSACVQCGSCTASCPTANRMLLNPQQMTRLVRLGLVDEVLASQSVWRCVSCEACSAHCPRGIPVLEVLIGLKAWANREGRKAPDDVALLAETIRSSRNVSGDPNGERLLWTENLPEAIVPAEAPEGSDLAFFVGCIASFYPRAFSVPQALARILQRAGIRYTLLGGEEWCCGFPLYNVGLEGEMRALVDHNVEVVERLGIRTLMTTCPSCYYAWKRLYPRFRPLPADLAVVHATEVLAGLLEEGRIVPKPQPRVVTYHDPCDLGRKGGEYDAPRRILRSLPGVEFREMANVRENALCCGGGGDVKIFSYDTTVEVARRRAVQAIDVGADTIVSACQQCKRALVSAVQSMRCPMKVLDVAELVWESLEGREP